MGRKSRNSGVVETPQDSMPWDKGRTPYPYIDMGGKKVTVRYKLFHDNLLRLVKSNFKWYGIESHEANMIEELLIFEGRFCGIRTEFNSDKRIPENIFFGRFGTKNGEVDFYGRPLTAQCSGYNGKVYETDNINDFVIGFDTMAYHMNASDIHPIYVWIDQLAIELDDAYSAWKTACETRKCGMTYIVKNEREAKLLRDVLSRVSENDPWIVVSGSEGGIGERPEALYAPTNSGILSEFYMQFMNTWGTVMDMLGLENNSQNKRERLIVSEAEMNRSLSRYIGADRLQARKTVCDLMNERFKPYLKEEIRVENYLASMVVEDGNDANIYGDNSGESGNVVAMKGGKSNVS